MLGFLSLDVLGISRLVLWCMVTRLFFKRTKMIGKSLNEIQCLAEVAKTSLK